MPALREGDVNVVFSSKTTADTLSALVNVVSYDLAVRMASVLKECSFQVVIAVSGEGRGGCAEWGGVLCDSLLLCAVVG